MGGSVCQLIAQAAEFLSSLFASSSVTPKPVSGGALPSAPVKDAPVISTSTNAIILAVTRDPALTTSDALFGRMAIDGKFVCFTMERTAVSIPAGMYRGYKRESAHFGMTVVGIVVPNRTDIECHPANEPCQLKGCIAVGESIDGDALDSSKAAFDLMMADLPDEFTVEVTSL